MKYFTIGVLSLLLFVPSISKASPDNSAKFTSMDISFGTQNEDKDHDTRLEIFIAKCDGCPAVAYLDIGGGNQPHVPNSGFPNNTTSQMYHVPTFQTGFTLGDLTAEKIVLKITPVGHDTWKFGFSATLHFSDGTTASVAVPNVILHQKNGPTDTGNQILIPLSGAVRH